MTMPPLSGRYVHFTRWMCLWALPWSMAATTFAQSFCASDGLPQPTALHERFISAECMECWGSLPSVLPHRQTLVLDWIVPSARGDEAPLSAAALPEALDRLEGLMAQPPAPTHATSHTLRRTGASAQGLRVAHGLAFNNYIGTSIRYQPPKSATHSDLLAWQLLVETIPAGSEGTSVERNLVRNVLPRQWSRHITLSNSKQASRPTTWIDSRPMSIPEGAKPERLRVVGWVEDATGNLLAIAQSRCATEKQ